MAKNNNLPLAGAQATSVGRIRGNNEDKVWIAPRKLESQTTHAKGYLGIVADGMGGPAKGEVASEIAVRQVAKEYYNPQYADPARALKHAIESANVAIFEAAQQPGYAGMGTTLVAAVIVGNRVIFANVGDSRGYIVSQGRIEQVTRDHSLVQERVDQGILTADQARQHQDKNLITRALGTYPWVEVDLFERPIHAGDLVVLCSDGVSNLVHDDEIAQIVFRNPPEVAAKQLVDLANSRGGYDNSTVAILPVGMVEQSAPLKPLLVLGPIGVLVIAGFLILALTVFVVRNPTNATPTAPVFSANEATPATPTLTSTPSRTPTTALTSTPLPTSTATQTPPLTLPTPTPLPISTPNEIPTPIATLVVVTSTPTPTPTPEPPPREKVIYNFDGTGIGVARLTELFKLVERTDLKGHYEAFYKAHPEIHCEPGKYDLGCVKGILEVKFDELAVMGLGDPNLKTQGPKWLILMVDENNSVNGLEALSKYKERWVLVRVRWENERYRIDPPDFIFVYDPARRGYIQMK